MYAINWRISAQSLVSIGKYFVVVAMSFCFTCVCVCHVRHHAVLCPTILNVRARDSQAQRDRILVHLKRTLISAGIHSNRKLHQQHNIGRASIRW